MLQSHLHPFQPIPLECLRSASFGDDPVVRKQDISLFNKIGSCCHSPTPEMMYPITIYHAAAKITRRYTLYAPSPRDRNRWSSELGEVIEAQKARQHGDEVPLLPFLLFSKYLIKECSYTGLEHLTAAFSACLHVSCPLAGSTSPAKPFVPLSFVRSLFVISFMIAHSTFRASRRAL